MLRWSASFSLWGGLALWAGLSGALALMLMFAAAKSTPLIVGASIPESISAAWRDDGARLWAHYQPRLPTPPPQFQTTLLPRGVMDGVGVVDFERQSDDPVLPPMIVAVGGAEGGFWLGGTNRFPTSLTFGHLLMRHGFSIRSISHFGGGPLPDWLGEGEIAPWLFEGRLEAIADVIRDARTTRGAQRRCIGFVGVSTGGELTLLLAGYGDELAGEDGPLMDAAVAAVPSHVVHQSPHRTLRVHSSWSLGGEPLDFVRYPWLSPHIPGVLLRDYDAVLALGRQVLRNETAVARAEIPVERAAMPVLMLGAARDHMWPSADMSRAALARAERLNPDHSLAYIEYDLDHFVLSYPEPIMDAVAFFYETLRQAAAEGRCEADFAEPWRPDEGAPEPEPSLSD
ncbi:MAG: hypothetical protein LAT81_11450 [Oceanicaulis sp.]|nr:hypothetical protein [Oceanicaulis sp.]